MKRFILLFTFITLAAFAGPVVFYNPVSYPVTNMVNGYAPIIDEVPYLNATNALVITNRITQTGVGVTLSNLVGYCVVDGQLVRLLNSTETSIIASNNAYLEAQSVIAQSNALVQLKYDARVFATNVVTATDGQSLYIRSLGEAIWFQLNFLRTNSGAPALSRGGFNTSVQTNISNFGQ